MSASIILRQGPDQITINRANPDVVLVGVAGPVGPGGAGGVLGYYGAFESYVNQTAASTTDSYPMAFEVTDEANGISMVQGVAGTKSRITFAAAGTYNVQFSAQFTNSSSNAEDVSIWLRKNGVDVAGSTGLVSIPGKHAGFNGHSITGWNFVFTVAANDYFEFWWQTESTNVSIVTYTGGTTPTTPSTASLVLTVTQVMNTQLGPTGPAGTITIGSTTTGSAGTNAIVSNVGTSTAAILNFTIPRGDTGATGSTGAAATITVGSTTTGSAGSAALVSNVGTSAAAILNFTIPQGATGSTGSSGTITIGSTTTGSAGSAALVSNVGTSTAAILNFTIPQGATGATGSQGASGDWSTLQTINTQTNSYTIVSSDVGKLVTLNSTGALSVSVNTGTVIGTGARIDLLNLNSGTITVGGTATVNGTPTLKLRAQYSAATLICIGSNSYVLVGDLAAS